MLSTEHLDCIVQKGEKNNSETPRKTHMFDVKDRELNISENSFMSYSTKFSPYNKSEQEY